MSDSSRFYLDKADLSCAVAESLQLSAMTQDLAVMGMDIGRHLLQSHRFSRYPQEVKDDLYSNGLLYFCRYWKNIKPEINPFSYITRTFECAYLTEIGKYYKAKNRQRQLVEDWLEKNRDKVESQAQVKYLQKWIDEGHYDSDGKPKEGDGE